MRIPKMRKNGDGRAFAVAPNSGGKRCYFGKHGTPNATRCYQLWLTRVLCGVSTADDKDELTVRELCDAYLNWLSRERQGDKPLISLTENAAMHLCEIAGSLRASELGPKTLVVFLEQMPNKSYTKHSVTRKYSRNQINKFLAAIKRLVKWGCSRELIPAELYSRLMPVDGLRRGKGRETKQVAPVCFNEVRKTLPYLPRTVARMAQVQYFIGARPSEVCNMRWEWTFTNTGEEVWLYQPLEHKNQHRGKHLVKAIPKAAQPLLGPPAASGYIFPRPTNPAKPMRVDTYRNTVLRALGKAEKEGVDIERWTPGQLRHSIATDIRKQLGQEQAQLYLGHSRLDTTAIYAERSSEAVAALASKLDECLFSNFAGT